MKPRNEKSSQEEIAGVDEVDEPEADPLLDRLPEYRGHGKIRRVLEILDNLEQGGSK